MKDTDFLKQNLDEFKIKEFVSEQLKNIGLKDIKLVKTPLGEKIIIFTSRPGLVVGRKGQNIKKLTEDLKKNFNLEKPQLEISEVENPMLNARISAERIASSLERFGPMRFKSIGYRVLTQIMDAGAKGAEIIISGKVPSARARSWRFYQGYLKKSGDVAVSGVDHSIVYARLKSGTVGIKVNIMPPNAKLPDKVVFIEEAKIEEVEEKPKIEENKDNETKTKKKDDKKSSKKTTKKKTKKMTKKKTEKQEKKTKTKKSKSKQTTNKKNKK